MGYDGELHFKRETEFLPYFGLWIWLKFNKMLFHIQNDKSKHRQIRRQLLYPFVSS
jgi:hypothetical protein